jgi:hypothetical protein
MCAAAALAALATAIANAAKAVTVGHAMTRRREIGVGAVRLIGNLHSNAAVTAR